MAQSTVWLGRFEPEPKQCIIVMNRPLCEHKIVVSVLIGGQKVTYPQSQKYSPLLKHWAREDDN